MSKAKAAKDETPVKNGKKRSSPLSSPEPTPKRSRKPGKASAPKATPRKDDGESPLTSPAPSDSESEPESEASRESTPEAMPKRGRRPTSDARKEVESASAPNRAKKRAAPRTSTPSAPSSSKPKAKRARQSLPAKLPSRDKPKEEGERFLDGEPEPAPKPKPRLKRASTNAVAKAKSGYLSTDEEEPVASSSRVTLSAKKTPVKLPRRGKNDPAAVFEKLQAAAIVNGSFSSLHKSSQTFVDEDDDEMTLDNVLKRRSASLSPPPGSPTSNLTPGKGKKSMTTFEPTFLPMG